ncbi:MAG: PQQ-binding-like beta-propeller repeat protein [Nannocystaceae bacterium]
MSVSARGLAALTAVAWLALGTVACGARDAVELIYPRQDDAARPVMTVDYTQQLTQPDNFVLRPDEFGGAAVDPQRGLLYAGSRDGFLFALEQDDGSVRWDLELGGAVGSVPVIVEAQGDDESMILVGTDNGLMHAIALSDRRTVWSYETPGRIRNPAVVHEGVVFFVNSRDQIYALDLRTGLWRWQYEQELQTDFTVHGHGGLSFTPAAEQGVELGTIHACFDNGKVVALAAGSGQALWIASVAPPEGGDFIDCDSTPLVDLEQGLVFVAGQSTGVVALELESGDERWRFPMRGAGSIVAASDGSLVGSSSLEGVFVLERDGSRMRWRSPTDPGVLSTPVVVGNSVFVTHSELGLLAFDLGTGELAAQLRTGSGMGSVPVYDPARQRLFAISNRGVFVALRVGDAVTETAADLW